jgi:hypothetical protein
MEATQTRREPQQSEAHMSALAKICQATALVFETLTEMEVGSDLYSELISEAHDYLEPRFGDDGDGVAAYRHRQVMPDAEDVVDVITARKYLGAIGADARLPILARVNSAIQLLDEALNDWGIIPPDHSVGGRLN